MIHFLLSQTLKEADKYGMTADFVSIKVLPLLAPMLAEPSLNYQQVVPALMTDVHIMLASVPRGYDSMPLFLFLFPLLSLRVQFSKLVKMQRRLLDLIEHELGKQLQGRDAMQAERNSLQVRLDSMIFFLVFGHIAVRRTSGPLHRSRAKRTTSCPALTGQP